jgi:hypothetical protein
MHVLRRNASRGRLNVTRAITLSFGLFLGLTGL